MFYHVPQEKGFFYKDFHFFVIMIITKLRKYNFHKDFYDGSRYQNAQQSMDQGGPQHTM